MSEVNISKDSEFENHRDTADSDIILEISKQFSDVGTQTEIVYKPESLLDALLKAKEQFENIKLSLEYEARKLDLYKNTNIQLMGMVIEDKKKKISRLKGELDNIIRKLNPYDKLGKNINITINKFHKILRLQRFCLGKTQGKPVREMEEFALDVKTRILSYSKYLKIRFFNPGINDIWKINLDWQGTSGHILESYIFYYNNKLYLLQKVNTINPYNIKMVLWEIIWENKQLVELLQIDEDFNVGVLHHPGKKYFYLCKYTKDSIQITGLELHKYNLEDLKANIKTKYQCSTKIGNKNYFEYSRGKLFLPIAGASSLFCCLSTFSGGNTYEEGLNINQCQWAYLHKYGKGKLIALYAKPQLYSPKCYICRIVTLDSNTFIQTTFTWKNILSFHKNSIPKYFVDGNKGVLYILSSNYKQVVRYNMNTQQLKIMLVSSK